MSILIDSIQIVSKYDTIDKGITMYSKYDKQEQITEQDLIIT